MIKDANVKVVVIGGGTGTSVVLTGLKQYPIDLSAVISMADTGGSTGRLRDEFGFQPVGDLRQGLAALAADSQFDWIRKLLLYRFPKGKGLAGHNLGNLILTALQEMTGSTTSALEIAAQIFRLKGNIYPVTTDDVQLLIEYANGQIEIGEKVLDEKHGGEQIVNLSTKPKCKLYSKAAESIKKADVIIIGPGDLYGSILPNLLADGIEDVFCHTKAKLVYILNLMTRYTQTHNFKGSDHIKAIESKIGRKLDVIIISNSPVPSFYLERYASQHEYPVSDDIDTKDYIIIRESLLKTQQMDKINNDTVKHDYLRHDSDKLARVIMQLCERYL